MISVVIPTFNRAGLLRHALDSVLTQTFRDVEIIVVDDGSTDDTRGVVRSYGQRVRYIYQDNQGRGAARNTGVLAAQGDYIAFLDSDDIWYPDHLQRLVDYLQANPDAEFLHGLLDVLNEDGTKSFHESKKLERLYRRAAKRKFTYTNLLRSCLIFSSTVLVKKTLFERVGLYDARLRLLEDVEWYLRAARVTRLHYLDGPPLASYRLHGENAFRVGSKHLLDIYAKIFEGNLAELERVGADPAARCEAHLGLSFCYSGLNQSALARRHIALALSVSPIRACRLEVLRRLLGTVLRNGNAYATS